MDFFFSFQIKYTKLKCKQERRVSPTVLLYEYERREVALVFYALEDVSRTKACVWATLFHRVRVTTANYYYYC